MSIPQEKTWIVVCRTSAEYNTSLAAIQKKQFELRHSRAGWNFICITDNPTESWHTPLESNLPGWWSLMEMFRFDGPHILTGLDTILLNDLDPFLEFAENAPENVMFGIRNFYKLQHWASGVTLWNGDWRWLYKACNNQSRRAFRGDQDFIESYVQQRPGVSLGFLDDHIPGIVSFKAHVLKRGLQYELHSSKLDHFTNC
jgi:hypothetical protein